MNHRFRPIAWVREGDCMICTSHAPDSDGYPRQQYKKYKMTIPRRIMVRKYGYQEGKVSRHTCDNRMCINPDHIICGSAADNNHDRSIRGRSNPKRGMQCHLSKLSEAQILEILSLRREGMKQRLIAEIFGVYQSAISRITRGERWSHLVVSNGNEKVERTPIPTEDIGGISDDEPPF